MSVPPADRRAFVAERRAASVHRFDTVHSPDYDEHWGAISPSHAAFVARLAGLVRPGGAVLDAACGTGKYWPALRAAGLSVTGADQSAGMLAQARRKHPDVPARVLPLQDLASLGSRFDGLICIDALECVAPEDWPSVLAGFSAVLLPTAPAYLTVELPDGPLPPPADPRQLPEEVTLNGGYHYYPRPELVRGWLADAGFAVTDEAEADQYWHLMLTHSPCGQGLARRPPGQECAPPVAAAQLAGDRGEEVAVQSGFNSDFYVTAATVIPVLYLALGVQGSLLNGVIARLNKSLRAMSRQRPDTPLRQLGLLGRVVVSYALMILAILIIAAGVVGEGAALLALYHQRGGPATGRLVAASLIALLVLTAVSPTWRLILAWPRLQWIPLKHAWWIVTHGGKGAGAAEPGWIRRATPEDLPSVQEVVTAAYARYLDRMDRPPAPLLADYRAVLEAGDLWVAGRPVTGLIVLTQSGDSLHVDNVAVHPSAQGTGLGRQLMEFAEQQAGQRGLRRLTLYTHEVMVENQLIYAHFGYREVYRRTENGYRRVYMEKLLPSRPAGEPGS